MLFIKKDENNLAFTLIELLAVIILLAIIALIATPIILGVIEDAKKESLKATAYGLMDGVKNRVIMQTAISEKMYTIENNQFIGDSINISGSLPESGSVIVDKDLKMAIAIKDGKWCAKKDYDEKEVMISDYLDGCILEILVPTSESCFAFISSTGTITSYYDYENEDSNNPACPREVVIPNTINEISVVSIGAWSFEGKHLTSATIGNGVTSIGDGAFQNNELTSLIIPNNVISIGEWVFSTNQLTSLTIGNNVTSISKGAFERNQLTDVIIPNSVTNIGSNAFYDDQLSSVAIGNGVTSIGDGAFQNNELTNLIIPNNVISIGTWVFSTNQLTSLIIGDNVTSIGDGAFELNRLTNVTIPSSVISIGSWTFSQTSSYPWGTVTIRYNGTNPANRFDSSLSDIGWDDATMSYVNE